MNLTNKINPVNSLTCSSLRQKHFSLRSLQSTFESFRSNDILESDFFWSITDTVLVMLDFGVFINDVRRWFASLSATWHTSMVAICFGRLDNSWNNDWSTLGSPWPNEMHGVVFVCLLCFAWQIQIYGLRKLCKTNEHKHHISRIPERTQLPESLCACPLECPYCHCIINCHSLSWHFGPD